MDRSMISSCIHGSEMPQGLMLDSERRYDADPSPSRALSSDPIGQPQTEMGSEP